MSRRKKTETRPSNVLRNQRKSTEFWLSAAGNRGGILMAAGAVMMLFLSAVVTPIGQKFVDRIFPSTGYLEKVDIRVYDASVDAEPVSSRVDIKVQNRGSQRVAIRRLVLTVKDFMIIAFCESEGRTEITGEYDLILPERMTPGDSIEFPIDQEVAPDEIDRFLIRLQRPKDSAAFTASFYRMGVSLETNGEPSRIDLGPMIISLPQVPSNRDAGWYWSSDTASGKMRLDWLGADQAAVESCMKDNSKNLMKFLRRSGVRSTGLTDLQADLR